MPDDADQPTGTRKRKSISQRVSDFKRRKLSDSGPQSPVQQANFYDGLSKIWLTKHALREFDRRAKLATNQSLYKSRRPRTRSYRKRLQRQPEPIQSVSVGCSPLYTSRLIKLSARRGGFNLSDLRGFPEPKNIISLAMSSSRLNSSSRSQKRGAKSSSKIQTVTTNTTVTKNVKNSQPKDPNYQQRLIDGRVYPYGYEYPDGRRVPLPTGWDDLNGRLTQSRPSLSPSRFPAEEYQAFVREEARASREAEVKDPVLPTMLRAMHASSGACKDQMFTTLDPMVDGIARAKPDYYYGAQPEQIHDDVRDELGTYILPSENSPAVPNFFMEAKGPAGSLAEGLRQVCHNGAIGARAMQSLQTYGQSQPIYDNQVRTVSSLYHGGTLRMYGHSVAQPNGPGTRPEYYMHQIKGWSMTADQETFLKGATAYKNALDLMAEYRNGAIAHANHVASATNESDKQASSFAVNSANSTPSATHDDDEDDDEDESASSVENNHRHPPSKRSSTKSHHSRRHHTHSAHKTGGSKSKGKQRKSWFGW